MNAGGAKEVGRSLPEHDLFKPYGIRKKTKQRKENIMMSPMFAKGAEVESDEDDLPLISLKRSYVPAKKPVESNFSGSAVTIDLTQDEKERELDGSHLTILSRRVTDDTFGADFSPKKMKVSVQPWSTSNVMKRPFKRDLSSKQNIVLNSTKESPSSSYLDSCVVLRKTLAEFGEYCTLKVKNINVAKFSLLNEASIGRKVCTEQMHDGNSLTASLSDFSNLEESNITRERADTNTFEADVILERKVLAPYVESEGGTSKTRWTCRKCNQKSFSTFKAVCLHEKECRGFETKKWLCEKCQLKRFSTYEECIEHEENCLVDNKIDKNIKPRWQCGICNLKELTNFEDACKHERQCSFQ